MISLEDLGENLPGIGWLLKILVAVTLVPYFAKHPRARRAWVSRYQQGNTDLGKLPTTIREDFIQHEDILDAWVGKRREAAAGAFRRIPSVDQRKIYIPLPLRIEGHDESRLLTDPKREDFAPLFLGERSVLVVIGPGGSGKSTIACRLGFWALGGQPGGDANEQSLAPHPMIPIFLDQEMTDLPDAILRSLRQMVGDDEVEPQIVESLLRHKRLLVIVDAMSEKSPETQRHIEKIHGEAPVNALVITTRKVPDFGPIGFAKLSPEKVELDKLIYFLTGYLRESGEEEHFPRRQPLILGDRIMEVIERGSPNLEVTPLLIKLFVLTAITFVQNKRSLEELPLSIPETMLDYLRQVNPQDEETPNRIPNARMIESACVLGWCCLKATYAPKDFYRDEAETMLEEEGFQSEGGDLIQRLIDNGVLEPKDVGGTRMLAFALDPLSEYVAALYWIDKLRGNELAWVRWIEELKAFEGSLEDIRGFLVAMEDCVTAYRDTHNIPDLDFPWKALAVAAA